MGHLVYQGQINPAFLLQLTAKNHIRKFFGKAGLKTPCVWKILMENIADSDLQLGGEIAREIQLEESLR